MLYVSYMYTIDCIYQSGSNCINSLHICIINTEYLQYGDISSTNPIVLTHTLQNDLNLRKCRTPYGIYI